MKPNEISLTTRVFSELILLSDLSVIRFLESLSGAGSQLASLLEYDSALPKCVLKLRSNPVEYYKGLPLNLGLVLSVVT